MDTTAEGGFPQTRSYQQEMFEESLHRNIIIALDTGSGKTHIAILRMRLEAERQLKKISWFLAPTVSLCEQQRNVIATALPLSVGLISGALEPEQWKNATLWRKVLDTHRVIVTTPQVLLDALRHGYVNLGLDIGLLIFDEAHHAVDNDPYNRIMIEFYFLLPCQPVNDQDPVDLNSQNVLVRPMILGLTASPIFGGNAEKAFKIIEENLDSVIRAPKRHGDELAKFVYRPTFKHILYRPPNAPFSTNLAALKYVVDQMDIEDDPYVKHLRQELTRLPLGSAERIRTDQKLSKTVRDECSFTHKGLRDFARSADEICLDLGSWAADWFVQTVLEKAKIAANPYNNIISSWKNSEKSYLLDVLSKVVITPISYHPDDIVEDCSGKVQALIECLISEKKDTEARNESYSGLVFVQRRDTVLVLTELLSHHPDTADMFRIGCLLGTSENAHRHTFLDITRTLLNQSQDEILEDFRIGEKNLIISTSVAEEGIDVQACGSVIRWDPPANMVSWTQSRGRARRQRSTFTVMFEDEGLSQELVLQWQNLEHKMISLYNNDQRDLHRVELPDPDDDENDLEFRIESTGAVLTLHSAVAHLSHFCAVMPNTVHVDHRPLYDLDPPELPEGWHSFDNQKKNDQVPYQGLYGSQVTLPRLLPPNLRVFTAERKYRTKISAHRHAAFKAYLALYNAGLLNDNLLPLTSVVEPDLEDVVKELLKDVEKRAGTARVSSQMDPWAPVPGSQIWWSSELTIDTFPPIRMLTRSQPVAWSCEDAPALHRPYRDSVKVTLRPLEVLTLSDESLEAARHYTRRLFWAVYSSRMAWDDLDFAYLFFPPDNMDHVPWNARRSWLATIQDDSKKQVDALFANAEAFGKHFSFPGDLTIIRNGFQFSKALRFLRWRFEALTPEEETEFREANTNLSNTVLTLPLLVAQPFPPRTNFLLPIPPKSNPPSEKSLILYPGVANVVLLSAAETEYAFLLPSVLRFWAMTMTVHSLRQTLFTGSRLASIPLRLLTTAVTAPASQEHTNYQRLETLGDTVLKFIVGIQLLAEYPLWHEGYLTKRKDHAVSNVRLAKEAIRLELYRWIIRDRLAGKKWKPKYLSTIAKAKNVKDEIPLENLPNVKKAPKEELSMKVLADVVESLIGAAYLHKGFDLGVECAQLFGLGLKWRKLPDRIEAMLSRVEHDQDYPPQLANVESMLGYTFSRKMLLIEALTHVSYQQDLRTVSYERMEFLGDSVLDMIVTDYLYHAPGKEYSPGHIHLRKSAMVNAHMLAYICLQSSLAVEAAMPRTDSQQCAFLTVDPQRIYLWQCLLHSNPRVFDDQRNTFARHKRRRDDIEAALQSGPIFPWAALTRLQAPKFFSDMIESLIGAVFLDTHGNLDVVRDVLRVLGFMQILERIVRDDIDVLHPVSRLSLWAQKHQKEVEYVQKKEKGNACCVILVDGEEKVRVEEPYRGRASQEEVKFFAAEKAILEFRLRDVNMNYTLLKGKRKAPKKLTSAKE